MGLATTTIAALLIWLSWGIYLNARQDLSSDFQAMTETFLRDWILSPLTGVLLKWWFIGLCLLMVLLGVSFIFCLMGWGDFWRWNYNFLSSALIVLYLMLAFHIPGKGRFSMRVRSLVGALTSLVMLGLTLAKGI